VEPREYLNHEHENAKQALSETLRQDYFPALTKGYYVECAARLKQLKQTIDFTDPADFPLIQTLLEDVQSVSSWITLIERAQLGSFSWPFSSEIRRIADAFLTEINTFDGELRPPIIHVIAEGDGYLIYYENEQPPTYSDRLFVLVAFPRSLKSHVLFHCLFGHELGHAALYASTGKEALQRDVRAALASAGPMSSAAEITQWLHALTAPQEVKDAIIDYRARIGSEYKFSDSSYDKWRIEFTCDLVGLMLFGPAFLAAHQAVLRPHYPYPYELYLLGTSTHPPYAVRQKMLLRALKVAGWAIPVSCSGPILLAEQKFLNSVTDDPYDDWADIFDDVRLEAAIKAIRTLMAPLPDVLYSPPKADDLLALVERLAMRLPPLIETVDEAGAPHHGKSSVAHILHAGWVYWTSNAEIGRGEPLTFFQANKLCDLAILQRQAMLRRMK
jgi:hypothetical protein